MVFFKDINSAIKEMNSTIKEINNGKINNPNVRLSDLEGFTYDEIKKKIFPLIKRTDVDINSDINFKYDEYDIRRYIEIGYIRSELSDLLKYDLNCQTLGDLIDQLDFDYEKFYYVGDEVPLEEYSDVALFVDRNGELILYNFTLEDDGEIYILSESDEVIKFLDEFVQLLTRMKKEKSKVFDFLDGNE